MASAGSFVGIERRSSERTVPRESWPAVAATPTAIETPTRPSRSSSRTRMDAPRPCGSISRMTPESDLEYSPDENGGSNPSFATSAFSRLALPRYPLGIEAKEANGNVKLGSYFLGYRSHRCAVRIQRNRGDVDEYRLDPLRRFPDSRRDQLCHRQKSGPLAGRRGSSNSPARLRAAVAETSGESSRPQLRSKRAARDSGRDRTRGPPTGAHRPGLRLSQVSTVWPR